MCRQMFTDLVEAINKGNVFLNGALKINNIGAMEPRQKTQGGQLYFFQIIPPLTSIISHKVPNVLYASPNFRDKSLPVPCP
jgi:hypothetical protein